MSLLKLNKIKLFSFLGLFLSTLGYSQEKIKVALIDTGLDLSDPRFSSKLCKSGHKDFTYTQIKDIHGHGTHIVGLIAQYGVNNNYCILIYKYYLNEDLDMDREVQAIKEAINNKVKIINLSSGGVNFLKEEYLLIKSHPEITFVVAAGNNNQNLDFPENTYYPASYRLPNIIAVGNETRDGFKSDSSNSGNFLVWEWGVDRLSTFPKNTYGLMSGTSQATAVHTGKLLNLMKFRGK